MKYCTRCLLPDTRPAIHIGADGICSGCVGHDVKEHKIDWAGRGQALTKIVDEARSRSTGYDCVVPVSGGKDSWYQVIRSQQLGLKPLAVSWRTPARTSLGQSNLESMVKQLGVDHLDYTIDPDVERRFMKIAFEKLGDPGLPMHMAIFTIPTRLAVQMGIPLIVWGENPQLEYGGTEAERLATRLDAEWLEKHGCMQGTNAGDWIGDGLTAQDLVAYRLPTEADLARAGFSPDALFLGAFEKWDSFENTRVAKEHGFHFDAEGARTGTWDFADIDCDFVSLHHLLKWHKFGMSRAFDNLSVQIRYGVITRDQGIDTLKRIGMQIPHGDVSRFCDFVGASEDWFWRTCETFRNQDIWYMDGNTWKVRDFLIDDFPWE